MYTYKVKEIVKVYDADTITAKVDLGFNIDYEIKVRLAWIDAPEIRSEGLISREALAYWLSLAEETNEDIYIKTIKDKTGRYIGEVYISSLDSQSLNDRLVMEGFAEYADY